MQSLFGGIDDQVFGQFMAGSEHLPMPSNINQPSNDVSKSRSAASPANQIIDNHDGTNGQDIHPEQNQPVIADDFILTDADFATLPEELDWSQWLTPSDGDANLP